MPSKLHTGQPQVCLEIHHLSKKTNRIQIALTYEHLLSYAVQKIILKCRADKFELLGHSGMSLKA
jgi:hypothetical protein